MSARILSRATSDRRLSSLALFDFCPPGVRAGLFLSSCANFFVRDLILASFSSRSAARILRASWNAWYGSCSKGMLPVVRMATRRRREPTGMRPALISGASNWGMTVFGSRSAAEGSLAGSACDGGGC